MTLLVEQNRLVRRSLSGARAIVEEAVEHDPARQGCVHTWDDRGVVERCAGNRARWRLSSGVVDHLRRENTACVETVSGAVFVADDVDLLAELRCRKPGNHRSGENGHLRLRRAGRRYVERTVGGEATALDPRPDVLVPVDCQIERGVGPFHQPRVVAGHVHRLTRGDDEALVDVGKRCEIGDDDIAEVVQDSAARELESAVAAAVFDGQRPGVGQRRPGRNEELRRPVAAAHVTQADRPGVGHGPGELRDRFARRAAADVDIHGL